ncbi:MAG TPA: LysR substrate-binding domain-containing protein [Desulfopila sp.]|nr:LysR substrate-binding domain-containing protein [Desulfopila sp.]
MDLPTDILRTFVTAADTGNYTDTAAIIHRTQSAVSMQIKRLEELVGYSLFQRNGRKMTLTGEGQSLLWYARRIIKIHDEAVAAMRQPELSGRVRIGAPDDYAERLLPLLLCRFGETHPHVQVEVSCRSDESMMQLLDNGKLDILIHCNSEVPLRGKTISRDQLVWVTSPKHLVHEQDPLPLAVYDCNCIYRDWAIKSLEGACRNYRIAYSSPSTTGILAAVKSGLAVTVAGRGTLADDFRVLDDTDGFPVLPSIVITIVKASNQLSQAAEALATYVVDSFNDLIS